ncbi:MAG: hypothetical protein M3Y71_16150 [Actinomycetota bacterium]|nr:hypothetical protein [Actinomycetota bacterium]
MPALTSSTTLVTSYVNVGVIHISWANLAVIGAMVLLFVLVLVLPFPGHHPRRDGSGR